MRTQVAIIGAGPAGTLLSHLLHRRGIESVVLERRSREHVLGRIRAGVLEHGSAELLRRAGLGERMDRDGHVHHGVNLAFGDRRLRIDFAAIGRSVVLYGQTPLQHDLYAARDAADGQLVFEAADAMPHDVATDHPFVTFRVDGTEERLDCDWVVGCDGVRGVCRTVIPDKITRHFERDYPFAWLGVASPTPPVDDELVYARSDRGFALCSMRSEVLSRYYVQAPLDTDLDEWSDDRFWAELSSRLPREVADRLVTGETLEKILTPLRSVVEEPMRHGRLLLAGDAAHVVPPTGAKGLNLAIADVARLSAALSAHYDAGDDGPLDRYSDEALRRVWTAVRFSWWLTTMMHRYLAHDVFDRRIQEAEFDHLADSEHARATFAHNYTGLPLTPGT